MVSIALKRLLQGVITLAVTVTAIFSAARLTGNPADVILPQSSTPADRRILIHQYGLDKSVFEQYRIYVIGLLHGKFGDSIQFRVPVLQIILPRALHSIELGAVAMILSVAIGIPLGVLSALRRGSWIDHGVRYVASFGQSVPPFALGIVLILLFTVKLRALPPSGLVSWESFILPSLTTAAFIIAGIVRLVRSSMLEVLSADYITLARSKGVSKFGVVWQHALPNAVIPVITFIGLMFGVILTAGVTVEVLFSWPGLAQLTYASILSDDYPLIQASVTVGAAIVIIVNMFVDFLYLLADPRVRR